MSGVAHRPDGRPVAVGDRVRVGLDLGTVVRVAEAKRRGPLVVRFDGQEEPCRRYWWPDELEFI